MAPQTAKREQCAALIAWGVGNAEACRIVGINRRTGKRWRHGRTILSSGGRRLHYPLVINARKRGVSPRYLCEDERVLIGDRYRAGCSVRAIARGLGRDPATISRELRRNRDPSSGQYRPFLAQRLAARRRARPRPGKLATDTELRCFVAERLEKRWSPEQISRALRRQFPDQPQRQLVPETIYQAIYRPELGGLRRDLPKVLRTGRRRRKPHRRPDVRRGRLVDMTMIDARPAEVVDRGIPGHWEGDLICGAGNRSAIGTLVERSSRYTILLHLPGRHTAEAVRDAVIAALGGLPEQLRQSLTWDQGSEMALHAEITAVLKLPVFFCEKASPWQRPSNEHTNGQLADRAPAERPQRPRSAHPAPRWRLVRQARRRRHPHPGHGRTSIQHAGHPAPAAQRPGTALRQRSRSRRRHPGLGTTRRNPDPRAGSNHHRIAATINSCHSHRVATFTGIRPVVDTGGCDRSGRPAAVGVLQLGDLLPQPLLVGVQVGESRWWGGAIADPTLWRGFSTAALAVHSSITSGGSRWRPLPRLPP